MLVSVIVPVYNLENYITDCLDALVVQTRSFDWECIVIDDGSTDRSYDVAHAIIGNDSRFTLIRQKNAGLSSVKNLGISLATGKYLMFYDGDDIISDGFLENLGGIIMGYHPDAVVPRITRNIENFNLKRISANTCFKGLEAKEFLGSTKNYGSSWNMIVKRTAYDGVTFPLVLFEDSLVFHEVVGRLDTLVYDKGMDYYYRIRENSIMNLEKTKEWYEMKLNSHLIFLDGLLQNNCLKAYSERYMQFLHTYFEVMRRFGVTNETSRFEKLKIPKIYNGKYIYKHLFIQIMGLKMTSKLDKIKFWLQ